MHSVYFRAVQLYLGGHERDKEGTLEERLDSLMHSSMFRTAVDRDDTMQVDVGPVLGTLEDQIRGGDAPEEFFSDQSSPIIGT